MPHCFLMRAASILLLGCVLWAQPEVTPATPSVPFTKVDLAQTGRFRRELTLKLLEQLKDPEFQKILGSRLRPEVTRLSLKQLAEDYAATWPSPTRQLFASQIQSLDLDVRQSKGLDDFSQSMLALEVIWPKTGPRVLDWERLLLAVRPQGPKRAVTTIEAYDIHGRLHLLSARVQPETLVLLPGTDRGEAKRAGITLVNAGLRRANLAPEDTRGLALEPVYCGKLTFIRLADDQEPWWKGASEVYAFTAGIDPLVDKPALKLIDLPYLTYEATDYFPNQLILFWNDWRFNAASFQLWEADDGTNYQDILTAVLAGVTTAMAAAGAPALAWIPVLATAIIRSMPAVWFKDNDDYLDTFYTLEKGQTYTQLKGAANNATISLVPYTLLPQ